MKLSIVIPAFNEEKLLPGTLEAVRLASPALHDSGITSEVILCDNNSTDRTAEIAREAGAAVVFEPQNQIGRARNTGAKSATGDWILFLDADSHPSLGLFGDLAAVLRDEAAIGGGCVVKQDAPNISYEIFIGLWNIYSRLSGCAAGSFLFCRTSAFRETGGFNESLFAAEELDLSKRLIRLGKSRRQRMRILHRHPLVTSVRKASLYSMREHLGFMARTVFARGKNLKTRDGCPIWYDGRR